MRLKFRQKVRTVAPKLITHFIDEDTKYKVKLPDSTIVVIEKIEDFREVWY